MQTNCDSPQAALKEAIDVLDGPTATAARLSVKQSTVSMWIVRGRVSDRGALPLSTASGVSVHRLRPDIFGAAPEQKAA